MRPFFLAGGGNICLFYQTPAIFKRHPHPHPYKISQSTADSVLPQSVRSWGVWISIVAPRDSVSNTFSCMLSLCINCNSGLVYDNATPHTPRTTRNFLAEEEVEVMRWPARNPDLNPIGHIWDKMMGLFIRDIGNHPTTVASLWEALLQAFAGSHPWKNGRPCAEHASTTEGRDGHQVMSYPISTWKLKDSIN